MERVIQDVKALDAIIQTTIQKVEISIHDIQGMIEISRAEHQKLKRELDYIRVVLGETIQLQDQLEIKYQEIQALIEKEWHQVQQEIGKAALKALYDQLTDVAVELRIAKERELSLKKRRDGLQLRLGNTDLLLEKTNTLYTDLGLILSYLQGDISGMTEVLEAATLGQLYGLRIIQAQEEERKRVAREIHDGPAQSMANVVLRADIVGKILDRNQMEQAKEELKDLKKLVRHCLSDVRRIIYDLRPMALDDLGLIPTLRRFVEEYSKRYGIKTTFTTIGAEERIPPSMEVAVFRLIQEALNNVAKHAKAKSAKVVLEFKPLMLVVMIQDDGIGMHPQAQNDNVKFGIMGMRERVRLIEGELKIVSELGKGTEVSIWIPVT